MRERGSTPLHPELELGRDDLEVESQLLGARFNPSSRSGPLDDSKMRDAYPSSSSSCNRIVQEVQPHTLLLKFLLVRETGRGKQLLQVEEDKRNLQALANDFALKLLNSKKNNLHKS